MNEICKNTFRIWRFRKKNFQVWVLQNNSYLDRLKNIIKIKGWCIHPTWKRSNQIWFICKLSRWERLFLKESLLWQSMIWKCVQKLVHYSRWWWIMWFLRCFCFLWNSSRNNSSNHEKLLNSVPRMHLKQTYAFKINVKSYSSIRWLGFCIAHEIVNRRVSKRIEIGFK